MDSTDRQELRPTGLPVHMDVELSSKCNLRCRFCHLSYFEPKDHSQISLAEFDSRIGPILPHLKSITLFNQYEPLTCRDFIPIFERIAQHDIETYFSTNGLLLDDALFETLVGRLTFLTVSVTGFTPATYRKNMGFDGLAKVDRNLARLNEIKKARGTELPILRISTVAMLDTLDELTSAIDFAARHDAREGVQVTTLKAHGSELVGQMPLQDVSAYDRATKAAIEYARSKGVKLVLQSGSFDENSRATEEIGHRFCDLPWHRLSVQPNGDVYPCPVAYRPIGNLADRSMADIWNGPELAEYRRGVNDPDRMNEDCRNCTHCRHRSLVNPEVNDYSQAPTYKMGLTRKEQSKRRLPAMP